MCFLELCFSCVLFHFFFHFIFSFWPITMSDAGSIIVSPTVGPTLELHQRKSSIWPANCFGGSLNHLHTRFLDINYFSYLIVSWFVVKMNTSLYCYPRNLMLRSSKFQCHVSAQSLEPSLQTMWMPATHLKQRKRHRWTPRGTLIQNQ